MKTIQSGMIFPIINELFIRLENEFLVRKFVTFDTKESLGNMIIKVFYKNDLKVVLLVSQGKILSINEF